MMTLHRNLRWGLVAFALAFLPVLAALGYWQVVRASWLRGHAENARDVYRRQGIERGTIRGPDGKALAEENPLEEGQRRYPLQDAAAHVIGYDSVRYGRAGLESWMDDALLGLGAYADLWGDPRPGHRSGNSVTVTLLHEAEKAAAGALGFRRGAVVAMDPRSGALLVCTSGPSFDPNYLNREYERLRTSPDSPFLDRARQGRYPPGSAFKIIVAAAALDSGVCDEDTTFECRGSATIGGSEVRCPRRHGRLSFRRAFALSCNVAFAQIGRKLGPERFDDYVDRLFLREAPPGEVPVAASSVPRMTEASEADLVEASFGQGKVVVTPWAMCMATAALANAGQVMQPYLVEQVQSPKGRVFRQAKATPLGQFVSSGTADRMRALMREVVQSGTGKRAAVSWLAIAGKTGTAETPAGDDHAWFVSFAPAQEPRAALAVVLEHAGAGGVAAARVTRNVMPTVVR